MLLADSTWGDVAARPPVLLVPVGSCEQHGPHLPLGTDALIAEAVAHRAARSIDDALVAPTLAITASGEHRDFPGTLSIGTAALTTVLVELVRSADWAAGVVLVNGHGGNAEAVGAAVATLSAEGRHVLPVWPQLPGADAHAGATETSLLLAVRPDLVALDRAEPGATAPIRDLLPALQAHGVRAVSANGVLGDPTGATADEGRRLLDRLATQVVEAVRAWRSVR